MESAVPAELPVEVPAPTEGEHVTETMTKEAPEAAPEAPVADEEALQEIAAQQAGGESGDASPAPPAGDVPLPEAPAAQPEAEEQAGVELSEHAADAADEQEARQAEAAAAGPAAAAAEVAAAAAAAEAAQPQEPPSGAEVKEEAGAAVEVKQEAGATEEVKEEAGAAEEVKEEARAAEEVKEEAGAAEEVREKGKPAPSDGDILARLRDTLPTVDLATTTEKQLRRMLEAHFGVDLSDKKKLLRAEIEAYLTQHQPAGEEEAMEEAAAGAEGGSGGGEKAEQEPEQEGGEQRGVKRRSRGSKFGSKLSVAMQSFLGVKSMPRGQVVKKLWEYIKANNLQDPGNKRRIILDDKLKTIFPGKSTDMFKMNKHLSKHCFTEDAIGGTESEGSSGDDESEDEASPPPAKRPRSSAKPGAPKAGGAKRSARSKSSGDGEGKPRISGFNKPCKLSPTLAAFVGSDVMARPDVTKFFFNYIKEKELKDEKNKQIVIADETLRQLTGEERFKAFSFHGLIKEHFLGYAD